MSAWLFEIYSNGLEGTGASLQCVLLKSQSRHHAGSGVLEYVYGWMGELSLYLLALIGFTAFFTILLPEVSTSGVPSPLTEL
jgi:hypothetical protein